VNASHNRPIVLAAHVHVKLAGVNLFAAGSNEPGEIKSHVELLRQYLLVELHGLTGYSHLGPMKPSGHVHVKLAGVNELVAASNEAGVIRRHSALT
jgi:hypothetical protein